MSCNTNQKVPDTGIHLIEENEEQEEVARGSEKPVGGEPTQIPVMATAHQMLLMHSIYLSTWASRYYTTVDPM